VFHPGVPPLHGPRFAPVPWGAGTGWRRARMTEARPCMAAAPWVRCAGAPRPARARQLCAGRSPGSRRGRGKVPLPPAPPSRAGGAMAFGADLVAYSCGGSRGWAVRITASRVPVSALSGHRRMGGSYAEPPRRVQGDDVLRRRRPPTATEPSDRGAASIRERTARPRPTRPSPQAHQAHQCMARRQAARMRGARRLRAQ